MDTARIARLFMTFCLCAPAATAFGHTFSLSQYEAELDRLTALANRASANPAAAEAAVQDLRGGWKVESGGQVFAVDTTPMVEEFEKLKASGDNRIADRLLQRLGVLHADALAFDQQPRDSSRARAALGQILGRREFHQVHGPSWLDRLEFRIDTWISRVLSRFFGSSSVPVINRILVWVLVAIAALGVTFLVYRAIRQNARVESITLEAPPEAAKPWRLWIEESEAAAHKGLWREAIHLAYWSAISFLEERGLWRPDQARTPREYVRLLPSTSEQRSALSRLTRQLEATWYGREEAGPEAFAEALTQLENLGCRRA